MLRTSYDHKSIVDIPYFSEYNAHTSTVRTWISQWFLEKIFFLFFKKIFTRINHCKFIHHKSNLKPLLSYLPCIVRREYFSIIFNVKKCTLYSIKYSMWLTFCYEALFLQSDHKIIVKCFESWRSGVVFTTLHFLRNLGMRPIS